MATTLSQGEEAQLAQTIEMFEVITQSQPQDYQSLEILKEAYSKLGRQTEVVTTSKRIAQAYVQMGQFSSAILEYETILQQIPNDPDVKQALKEIESRSSNVGDDPALGGDTTILTKGTATAGPAKKTPGKVVMDIDDGRKTMQKIFLDAKILAQADFDLHWQTPDPSTPPTGVIEPFIQRLADKGICPVDKAIKLMTDKSRLGYLPLEKYDIDIDLARSFPAATCQRWCVLPFDKMSKSTLVATANPFNQQAAKELASATSNRLLWYVAQPSEIVKILRKAFR